MALINRIKKGNYMNLCPQCGREATYIVTQGITITSCSHCSQATILNTEIIIRIPKEKHVMLPPVKAELLMLALVAKALYDNWHVVSTPQL